MEDIIKSYKIPSELVGETIDVFGEDYQEMILNEKGEKIANVETKEEFALKVIDHIFLSVLAEWVIRYRTEHATVDKNFSIEVIK